MLHTNNEKLMQAIY